ncbi:HAD family hydrolase [Maribacter sp. 2307ULW6-5]|uniref:HAD family hydrolase n=1 Tax=Maribacter sp. 2307ULW6-5 TaxID=3386275 RepID=UPI0039BCCD2D
MRYKCIIFDCDGVLVDSEHLTTKVLVQMAAELGVHLSFEFATAQFLGRSFNDIMADLGKRCNGELPSDFEVEYRKRTFKAFDLELRPIPGIHTVLRQLQVPYCVASSGPIEKIERNLETVRLAHHFQGKMFSCYEMGKWKPEPDIFLHAAKVMGFAPEDCAVVEDSPLGVQAAVKGGFDVFHFLPGAGNKQKDLENGVVVFTEMQELVNLIR